MYALNDKSPPTRGADDRVPWFKKKSFRTAMRRVMSIGLEVRTDWATFAIFMRG
jgi:hypothetical protein